MLCGSCRSQNSPEARFCQACGTALHAGPVEEAARKIVTVVFIDIAGSTALGERLDPEVLLATMTRYFDTAKSVLERRGGTVEKFIGDAVMAVFGMPSVREDDALRAVRAALEMRAAMERLNDELERSHGVRLLTRTGINTGEVVVGGAGATFDQRLATGDAVNVAARLEQTAAPGEIRVGADTQAALRDAAELEALPPIEAKGKREPLQAWRLLGVRPGAVGIRRTSATPFIGRQRELDNLRQVFETAVRGRSCHLVTIVAPPGTGKSRLAREFLASVSAESRAVVGRCTPDGEGVTYLPLAEVVRELAGDAPGPRLAELLRDVDLGEVAARLVMGAIGASGDPGAPEETAWAFRRLLETVASEHPLVLLVDDIHWAEPALLDLLEYVVGFSIGTPILVLCLARPDLLETRPSWSAPQPHATLLTLEPLPSEDAAHLVDGLCHGQPLPAEVRRRIVETAEGNPLFVEQILAMLADRPDAGAEAVPPTIHALLAARLDGLPLAERTLLQRAAVQGRVFHRGAVAELLGAAGAAGLGASLLSLARKAFVRPDRASVAGDDSFRFNHALIRDVAYASLTKEARARLHAQLAVWLERQDAGLAAGDEIRGYHLEQAVRCRAELGRVDAETRALASQGAGLLAAAGRRALHRGEAGAAAALLGRATRLVDAGASERALLLTDLARALRGSGALDAAGKAGADAVLEARRVADTTTEQRAELELAHIAFMRDRLQAPTLRAVAERAIAEFERRGSQADLADAWRLMGTAELVAGDRGAQLEALRRGRTHAIASGDMRRQIDAWNEVGGAMLFGRTPVAEVLAFLDEELAWARQHGLAAVEADALLGGPYLYARLGRFDEARESLERSKEICRALGIRYGLAEAHWAGAAMELLAGDTLAAEQELRAAIDVAIDMGASRYEAMYRLGLAHVLLTAARDDDAQRELERTSAIYGTVVSWKMARARLLARAGKAAEAVSLAQEGARSMATTDDLTQRAGHLMHLAEVLMAAGDREGARETILEAAKLHDEKGNLVPADQCRRLLATL